MAQRALHPRPLRPGPLGRRLVWFIGLWLAGVALVAAVAGVLKLVLAP